MRKLTSLEFWSYLNISLGFLVEGFQKTSSKQNQADYSKLNIDSEEYLILLSFSY